MLEWTGERFIPGEGGTDIRYEHTHRYSTVAPLLKGRRVLDVGSGEGYGSATLALFAETVIGVDVDDAAVGHARERHGHRQNVEYSRIEPGRLPFEDAEFDVVVCFEVIEHLERPQDLLPELARVLTSAGTLFISTPNKRLYSDARNYSNEYHLREFYMDEFRDFLRTEFKEVEFFGQRLLATSFIWHLEESMSNLAFSTSTELSSDAQEIALEAKIEPMYVIAACSQATPLDLSSSILVTADDALTREMDGSVPYTKVRQLLDDMDEERARAQAVLDNWEAELNNRAAALEEAAAERARLESVIAQLQRSSDGTVEASQRRKFFGRR